MWMSCLAAVLSILQTPVDRPADRLLPTDVKNLVCFWDFQEAAGEDRVAKGPNAYRLKEAGGPIARADDGVFGMHSAELKQGQWFRIARADGPALDIHGKDAQVTVIAWIHRGNPKAWQAIAGVWDETRGKRQYCLFLNAASRTPSDTMVRVPSKDCVHGHVSAVGGPTPGQKFCITYSSGATAIPLNQWHVVAMTYDGQFSRVYVDGKLDAAEKCNPFPYADGLFDGGKDGADFTVGSVSVAGKPGNFFVGRIGGLAVYNRALSDDEIAKLSTR